MMKVFYRIYPRKPNDRPFANGDKLKLVQGCLRSFMSSVAIADVCIVFLLDGCPTTWSLAVHDIVRPYFHIGAVGYDVVKLEGIGNKPSFLKQLEMALDGPDDEFVYFAEDDYLYRPGAIAQMLGFSRVMGSFVSPYDHPDRYRRGDDRHLRDFIDVVDGWHWRSAESTTMTFGAKRGLLRDMSCLLQEYACEGRKMWYPILDAKNQLWTPIPSLATHVQDGVLAPCVDWEKYWHDSTGPSTD